MSALMKEQINLLPATDDAKWQAVLAKDSRCDGQFVFAVSSTGIYCRPSCGSRRPRREHVSFFPLPERAEQAERAEKAEKVLREQQSQTGKQ